MTSGADTALIIGAGPAGLTAASELLDRTSIRPVVVERDSVAGGISRTVSYKGYRFDIGGHRFFSKSDRVNRWWLSVLPLQRAAQDETPSGMFDPEGPDPRNCDDVMLARRRLSRILYLGKFFDYPIILNMNSLANLGMKRIVSIGLSYLHAHLFPTRPEKSLEDFLVNRFGETLYRIFFKDYTQKVWGVGCDKIDASWGVQRIKGLTMSGALLHAMGRMIGMKAGESTETTLIDRFWYPKFGPGQLWEKVAEKISSKGGAILFNHEVESIVTEANRVRSVRVRDIESGRIADMDCDFLFSTMPISRLVSNMTPAAPQRVLETAKGLKHRDFILVGLIARRFKPEGIAGGETLRDNWIYIQEPKVRLGRLQIFNNWSPYMTIDPSNLVLGLEYFADEGDDLWVKSDDDMRRFAIDELNSLGLVSRDDVLDGLVVKMRKVYPAYFGAYADFGMIRNFVDDFGNLYPIGRSGMHRYNNADHSMLTAMTSVDNIISGRSDKSNIWDVNTEGEYQE